jgi:hypothetical protein
MATNIGHFLQYLLCFALRGTISSIGFFLAVLGVWIQSLVPWIRQVLDHLIQFISSFCTSYFCDRVSLYARVTQTAVFLFDLLCIAGMTGACYSCPAIGWDGGLTNFLPGLALDHNSPNLISQVTMITDLRHTNTRTHTHTHTHTLFPPMDVEWFS